MVRYDQNKIKVPRFSEENGFYTTAEKSKQMSKVRGKNTKPELKLRKALWSLGYRYRLNVKNIPGKPDIVFRKYKLAIFVDGEFWHGYNWDNKRDKIKKNRDFWIPKIERNIQRDTEVNQMLRAQGWYILRFWEQEIQKEFGQCLREIIDYIEAYTFNNYL